MVGIRNADSWPLWPDAAAGAHGTPRRLATMPHEGASASRSSRLHRRGSRQHQPRRRPATTGEAADQAMGLGGVGACAPTRCAPQEFFGPLTIYPLTLPLAVVRLRHEAFRRVAAPMHQVPTDVAARQVSGPWSRRCRQSACSQELVPGVRGSVPGRACIAATVERGGQIHGG